LPVLLEPTINARPAVKVSARSHYGFPCFVKAYQALEPSVFFFHSYTAMEEIKLLKEVKPLHYSIDLNM